MGDVTRVLQDLNISIVDNNGQCRSLRDILEELNELWTKLTEKQRDYYGCNV